MVYSKVNSLSHLQFLVKVLENKQKNVIQTLSRDANIFFGVEILGNSSRLTSDLQMFLIQTLSRDANIFFSVEILGNSSRLTSD